MWRRWVRRTQHPPDGGPSVWRPLKSTMQKMTKRQDKKEAPLNDESELLPAPITLALSQGQCGTQLGHPLPSLEKWVGYLSKWTVLHTPNIFSETRAGQELTGVCHHGRAGFRLLGSTRETCSTQYFQLTPKLSGKMSLSPYLSLVLYPLAVPSPHWYIYGPAFQDAFCVFIPGFNISHPL